MKKIPSLLALSALSLFGVACQNKNIAQSDPYGAAQPYGTYGGGAAQQDPYASTGEYDNVYQSGGGGTYNNTPAQPQYSGGGGYSQQPSYDYSNTGYNSGGYSSGGYSSGGSYTTPATQPSYSGSSYSGGSTYSGSAGGSSHTVQRGDTLFNISKRYGTSVSAIRSANGLNGDLIRIGDQLVIP